MAFSTPIQQFVDEHRSLRVDMNLFYDIAEDIAGDSGPTVMQLFIELHQQISAFTDKLRSHSIREEKGLFPLVSLHLGESDKTIVMMELEHQKAEGHLESFLSGAEQVDSTIDDIDIQSITISAVQAHATLTEHFAKEEKVLFPLAEDILSADEKQELEQLLTVMNTL